MTGVSVSRRWTLCKHKQKTSHPLWDERRYKHPAVPPKIRHQSFAFRSPCRFGQGTSRSATSRRSLLLTNISLPVNVGKTAQTTKRNTSFTFAAREGTSTDFGRVQLSAAPGAAAPLWRLPSDYFPLSQPFFDGCNYLQISLGVKSLLMMFATELLRKSKSLSLCVLSGWSH